MQPYSVLPEEVNDNQIKALVNYIQSQKLTDHVPSPTNLGVIEAIKNQQVIAPTANDFRRYAADVALNSQLGGEWWNPKTRPDGYKPVSRTKSYGEATGNLSKRGAVPPPEYEEEEIIEEAPPDYSLWSTHPSGGPVLYTPGFENYVDPWIAWENAWGETYTPQ